VRTILVSGLVICSLYQLKKLFPSIKIILILISSIPIFYGRYGKEIRTALFLNPGLICVKGGHNIFMQNNLVTLHR
jgi:hypothetical protein